jgi:hypothetical protein
MELLVRAALKSVFGLCSLIASRPFSAPPNFNPQPGDRRSGLFFCQCSYSTILRGVARVGGGGGKTTILRNRQQTTTANSQQYGLVVLVV